MKYVLGLILFANFVLKCYSACEEFILVTITSTRTQSLRMFRNVIWFIKLLIVSFWAGDIITIKFIMVSVL